MLLQGKTVLVVEPEAFSAYALESQFRNMSADNIILAKRVEEAMLVAAQEPRIDLAIVDCDQFGENGAWLAGYLRERGIKVVQTKRDAVTEKLIEGVDHERVSKPYFMIDIERAVAAQYGRMI